MSFRERPEYGQWRDAVFAKFGTRCIVCGHEGNLHAHHVLPVETYPELALDPENGVPLCGNCHAQTVGQEMAHVERLRQLQRQVLGTEGADAPSAEVLRQRAEANPSDSTAVADYLWAVPLGAEAVNFFARHKAAIKVTPCIAAQMRVTFRSQEDSPRRSASPKVPPSWRAGKASWGS